MTHTSGNQARLLYPPGGFLIWIIIGLELVTFAAALAVFLYKGMAAPALFHESSIQLNTTIGTVNVVVLLVSGYLLAMAMQFRQAGHYARARSFVGYCMAGGGVFLILKTVEYARKISHGFHFSFNDFFTFYWALTAFHALHVVVGLLFLWSLRSSITEDQSPESQDNLMAAAAFWHMCDLIWLMLFPTLYLVF